MNTKHRLTFWGAALAALILSGCSPQMQEDSKVQSDLHECARQALIEKTQDARVWADRAIQVDPNRKQTYTGPTPEDDAQASQGFGGQSVFGQSSDIGIATVFSLVGDDPTLVSYMRDAVRKFPDDVTAWALLVDAEDRLGQQAQKQQDAKALAAQIETLLTKPKTKIDGTLLSELGQAYFDAGDEVNGQKNYRKAIATYSTDPTPQNGLAYHFAVTNNTAHLAEALALANEALRLTRAQKGDDDEVTAEREAGIQDTVAWVQYRQGDFKNALMNLTEAASASPRSPETRYHLGMVYLAMGDKFGARTEMRHALLLNHSYADAQNQANLLQNVPAPVEEPDDDKE